MAKITQMGLQHSVIEYLKARTGLRTDWVYDGYVKPKGETFITVEQMQNNYEYIVKLRESVQAINRFQVGLHAMSSSERSRLQDEIKRIFIFDRFPYIDTSKSPAETCGFFNVELTAEVPMTSDDITDKSGFHTIYFDIEIDTINRR